MRPQFIAGASPTGAIAGTEVHGVINEDSVLRETRTTGIAVDVRHLPCGTVGGIVRPQFSAAASIVRVKIDGVSDEELQVVPGIAAK